MQHVLVTGAGGYIGSALVPQLLAAGNRVRAVDRFFFGRDTIPAPQADRLEVVQEDCRYLTPAHLEGIDAVIDLVAISNDPSGELFQQATWEINRDARVRCAALARDAGASRYILPSSCSIYGFQPADVITDETAPTNPLTTYAQANEKAEDGTLALADENFSVVVLRQATIYGYAPRMRFDLAINGMTYGAWKTGKLPLMRDGTQWRPMLHVADAAAAQIFMLEADRDAVNGHIFNVGSADNVYQIGPLAELVAARVPRDVEIEWYGDPDERSYRVSFDRLHGLGFRTARTAEDGVDEICAALDGGDLDKTPRTITLDWYRQLHDWHAIIRELEMHGGMLEIDSPEREP